MFHSAQRKLEDARINLEQLQTANDAPAFRSAFNSFLGNARAVTYALQNQGSAVAGFSDWYTPKQAEMKSDELLRFVHEARTEDFHEGRHRLSFSTYVQHLATENIGPPPQVGAALTVGTDGPYWIVDGGTPRERRIPIKKGANYRVSVSILNAPRMHRGTSLERNDPISVCRSALCYMEELVHEANNKFEKNRTVT